MAAQSFSILILAPASLAEAVVFSGLIKRLVDEIPNARFTVVGDPAVTALYRDVPGLDRMVALERTFFGVTPRLWLALRRRRWGLVLDLAGHRFARSLRSRRKALRRGPAASGPPVHKVAEGARILRLDDEPPPPFIFTRPETEAAAASLLASGAGEERPILALAPGADWIGKAWPAERYAVLAAELLGPKGPMAGGRLMIVGGAEDRWATEAVRRVIARDRLIDLTGRADLVTTYACLKRARLFIGNDSVATLLAGASGAPTLALFGPTDERVWGPWRGRGEALRGPRDLDTIRAADPGLNQAVCHMQDLPVAWVSKAARRLLAASTAPEAGSGEASDG